MNVELAKIYQLAKQNKRENEHFRLFLKQFSSKEVDATTLKVYEKVSAEIDCTTCGNCCKLLEPPVNEQDITFFAKKMNLSETDFLRNYVQETENKKEKFLCVQPCVMLHENRCTIYENRPESCADYPHLQHGAIKYRMKSILANYAICPIVFRTIENLKKELNFIKD